MAVLNFHHLTGRDLPRPGWERIPSIWERILGVCAGQSPAPLLSAGLQLRTGPRLGDLRRLTSSSMEGIKTARD